LSGSLNTLHEGLIVIITLELGKDDRTANNELPDDLHNIYTKRIRLMFNSINSDLAPKGYKIKYIDCVYEKVNNKT